MGVGMGGWSTAKVALQSMVVLSFILTVIDLVLAQHEGEIHLVHGTSSRNGRLEVYRGKEWVTIFDDGGFGLPEAVVACRQMGYRSGAVAVYHNGMFGRGTSDMRLYEIHCEGREMSLVECSHSACMDGLECNLDNDIGVSCGSSEDERYFRTTGFRRWSGFVVLLIAIPFCGHAYKRRSAYGQQSRSLIPIPRYHNGRVPLTSPLDDTAVTSSPGSPMQSFPNSPEGLPPEPVARVYPHGYVSYPHSTTAPPLRPMAAILPTPALDTPNGLPRPSHFITSQPNITPEGMQRTNPLPSPYSVPPPDYSELDGGMTSPRMSNDSVLILDPPPKYEDIVKS